LDSADPTREEKLKEVRLEGGGRGRVVRVENTWRHDGRPVFKFEGIDSISDAEPWEGAEIQVPADEVERPEEGAYSYAELVGCRVEVVSAGAARDGATRPGTETPCDAGIVTAVEEYGGPPLLRVEKPDGGELLIPFARAICKEIDVGRKVIRVELPVGLLDL
jgi:16S rRNA processing protein RimM